MGMASKFRVTYTDGSVHDVLAGPKAQVEFERKTSVPIPQMASAEHVYRLAWTALRVAGETVGFDEWLGTVLDVEENPRAAAPDPTLPDQPSEV